MNEATYWRQRYEMLMANFANALEAARLPPPPVMLAEKESYEAGRIAGMAAQRKPWAGLTEKEKREARNSVSYSPLAMTMSEWTEAVQDATEAKLKEKNT